MFYLTTHSTHFIYGYMASDIWLRTILIVRKETRCRHIGYSFRLAARVLLYAPSHRQDNTYHGLCYTSRGALAGTRNSFFFIRERLYVLLAGYQIPPTLVYLLWSTGWDSRENGSSELGRSYDEILQVAAPSNELDPFPSRI